MTSLPLSNCTPQAGVTDRFAEDTFCLILWDIDKVMKKGRS